MPPWSMAEVGAVHPWPYSYQSCRHVWVSMAAGQVAAAGWVPRERTVLQQLHHPAQLTLGMPPAKAPRPRRRREMSPACNGGSSPTYPARRREMRYCPRTNYRDILLQRPDSLITYHSELPGVSQPIRHWFKAILVPPILLLSPPAQGPFWNRLALRNSGDSPLSNIKPAD